MLTTHRPRERATLARALTGPQMQGRLITTLSSRPATWTNDQLCQAIRLDTVAELRQLAHEEQVV